MRAALFALLGLAACGADREERAPAAPAARPSSVLAPLSPEAYDNARSLSAGCDFRQGPQPLLVALPEGAIISRDGRPETLRAAGVFDSTGGTFVGDSLRIAVERLPEPPPETIVDGRWPARLRLADDSRDLQETLQGYWSCGELLRRFVPQVR